MNVGQQCYVFWLLERVCSGFGETSLLVYRWGFCLIRPDVFTALCYLLLFSLFSALFFHARYLIYFVCLLLHIFEVCSSCFGGEALSPVAVFCFFVLWFARLSLCSHFLGFKQQLLQHEIYPSWEKMWPPPLRGPGSWKKVIFFLVGGPINIFGCRSLCLSLFCCFLSRRFVCRGVAGIGSFLSGVGCPPHRVLPCFWQPRPLWLHWGRCLVAGAPLCWTILPSSVLSPLPFS